MTMIVVPCPSCQGEGRDIRCGIVYEPGCGHPHMGDVDYGICLDCLGTGDADEETQARTLEDLEQEDYEMLEAAAMRRQVTRAKNMAPPAPCHHEPDDPHWCPNCGRTP